MPIQADVIAEIEMLSTEEGGRKTPTPADQFGCICDLNGALWDCRLLLNETGSLAPGAKAIVPIAFLTKDVVRQLTPGTPFRLRELRHIANGKVLQVVHEKSYQ